MHKYEFVLICLCVCMLKQNMQIFLLEGFFVLEQNITENNYRLVFMKKKKKKAKTKTGNSIKKILTCQHDLMSSINAE